MQRLSRGFALAMLVPMVINLGIGFGAGWFAGIRYSEALPLPEPKREEVVRKGHVWVKYDINEAGARKCPPVSKRRMYVINKFECPAGWKPPYDIGELEECQGKLEDIQKWCNPYCQEELEECQVQLLDAEHQCLRLQSMWGI